MANRIDDLMDQIHALQLEVEAELARQAADLKYGLEHGRAVFEEEGLRRHREMQMRLSQ